MKKSAGLVILLLCLLLSPHLAFAHAVLLQANPPPDSHLDVSPSEISLTFNERLEKELYYIRVYDARGKTVTSASTYMSADQTQIRLPLPALGSGVYTVSYHIISADGHPVENAYILYIGEQSDQPEAPAASGEGHQHGGVEIWFDRMIYYISFLGMTGWLFWGMICSLPSENARRQYDFWLKTWKIFYAMTLAGIGFVQISDLLSGTGWSGLVPALIGTTFGRTWLFSVLAVLCVYPLLHRWKSLDALWICALWSAEGVNGHAATFQPLGVSVLLDIVHLAASSIWAGGLFLLLAVWRKEREWVKQSFLPLFSRTALWSIVALIGTGLAMTWIFVAQWQDLFVTEWGILLLIKSGLLVLVVLVAARLRFLMRKRRDEPFHGWVKNDFILMLLIVLVVGGLTYTSPSPSNAPLIWNAHANDITIDAAIQPNNPGVENSFNVRVTADNPQARPKQVELWLIYSGQQAIAPIRVPLVARGESGHATSDEADKSSSTVGTYLYSGNGSYLSIPGKWRVEVRIIDEKDDETDFATAIRLYPIRR